MNGDTTPEGMPELPRPYVPRDEQNPHDFYTADQMRAFYQAGRAAGLEEAAKACEKRAEERFSEYGTREPDTNAGYYGGRSGEIYESMDEEDEFCAAAIRAMKDKT